MAKVKNLFSNFPVDASPANLRTLRFRRREFSPDASLNECRETPHSSWDKRRYSGLEAIRTRKKRWRPMTESSWTYSLSVARNQPVASLSKGSSKPLAY